jgi:hypothetical protein
MKITPDMLQASTKTAIGLGVLPRLSFVEDIATNVEIMQEILKAALATESFRLRRLRAAVCRRQRADIASVAGRADPQTAASNSPALT